LSIDAIHSVQQDTKHVPSTPNDTSTRQPITTSREDVTSQAQVNKPPSQAAEKTNEIPVTNVPFENVTPPIEVPKVKEKSEVSHSAAVESLQENKETTTAQAKIVKNDVSSSPAHVPEKESSTSHNYETQKKDTPITVKNDTPATSLNYETPTVDKTEKRDIPTLTTEKRDIPVTTVPPV